MPTIFRIYCEFCDKENSKGELSKIESWYNKDVGKVISLGTLGYLNENNEITYLYHPLEEYFLKEIGDTHDNAWLKGRLVWENNVICPDCGEINQIVHLNCFYPISGTGCLFSFPAAILVFIILKYSFHFSVGKALLFGYTTLFLPSPILSFYVWLRYHKKNKIFKYQGCQKCDSKETISFEKISNEEAIICSTCGQKKAHLLYAGRS